MPVPMGLGPDLTQYLSDLEARVERAETPRGFTPAFLTTSASLNTTNAAQSGARWAILTDLKTAAYSDGAHWYNLATGAQIV